MLPDTKMFPMRNLLVIVLSYIAQCEAGRVRVCYYSNWSQYRPGIGKFVPSDIDPFLCTHIMFSFAKLDPSTLELTNYEWNDISALYPGVQNLKKANTNLKTLLAVGGWNEASERFTKLVSDVSLREKFVKTSVTFLRDNGFDGLDLDWEYPAKRGGFPSDKQNYVLLMQELMTEFKSEASRTGRPRLLLTAAVPAGVASITPGYDIPALNRNLDFINLMSYDLNGAWNNVTGHNSPLFSRAAETGEQAQFNVEFAANYWVEHGASRQKLVIGLATYGRGFQLASTSNTQMGAAAVGPCATGTYTREPGFLAYYEICSMLNQGTRYWDDESKVPFLVVGDQWIGYDDVTSIRRKLEWIRDNDFAGAMVWNLDLDDFQNICNQGRYPLTGLIKTVLGDDYVPPVTTSDPVTNGPTSGTSGTVPPTTPTMAPTTGGPAPGCMGNVRYIVNPYDCRLYWECVHGVAIPRSCNSGLYWNPARQYCDWEYNVACNPIEVPTTPLPTNQPSTTQGPTTQAPTTQEPTTQEPTTQAPTSQAPTTQQPTTQTPATQAPTTQPPTEGPTQTPQTGKVRICYYSNWSQYRPGIGKFVPSDIDPFLCTHIMFSFAKLDPSSLELTNYEWNDISALYPAVQNLKMANPNLKTLLAVGGWNEASERFTKLVSDVSLREKFVKTSVTFLRDNGFDGLDLDWEYPAKRGGVPSDKQNYVLLMQELMTEFKSEASRTGRPRLLLTAAVPAGVGSITPGYDIPALNRTLDFINLMSYDLNGAWNNVTGHNSPLFSRADETGDQAQFNVEFAANYWVQQGASRDKLVIGLATYGRGFKLTSISNTQMGAPASGASNQGPYTGAEGFIAYYEVCPLLNQGTRYWDDEGKVPFLVVGDQWFGYDDVTSIRYKLEWIRDNDFAGAMVWNIDLDDFQNVCNQGRYPLTGLIKTVLGDDYVPPVTTSDPVTNGPSSGTSGTVPPTSPTMAPTTDGPAPGCLGNARYIANPYDCHLYWECVHGVAIPRSCNGGLYWNPARQYCDWEYNVDCYTVISEVPTTQTPVTQSPTTQPPPTQPPTTQLPTNPSTQPPSTQPPTTQPPTTQPPSTQPPTTQLPTTQTTPSPSTPPPTTPPPTTQPTSTQPATTQPSTTLPPSTQSSAATRRSPATGPTLPPQTGVTCTKRFIPDPTTCDRYFECSNSVLYHWACSPGLYWNQQQSYCDWPENVDCQTYDVTPTTPSSTTPISTTTTSGPTTTTDPSAQDPSSFCDDREDGIYASPYNCADFYQCVHGETYLKHCHPGTVWSTVGFCDWETSVDCGARPKLNYLKRDSRETTGFCDDKADGYYMDDSDCHSYYQCYDGRDFHRNCGNYLKYDASTLTCNWPENVDCENEQRNSHR